MVLVAKMVTAPKEVPTWLKILALFSPAWGGRTSESLEESFGCLSMFRLWIFPYSKLGREQGVFGSTSRPSRTLAALSFPICGSCSRQLSGH